MIQIRKKENQKKKPHIYKANIHKRIVIALWVRSVYKVTVYVDGSGNMVLIKNPTITSIPVKSGYTSKAKESDGFRGCEIPRPADKGDAGITV
ncbi:MAG: hypothetical protein PHW34_08835 [Hespellia sp.]|nr:hypothetical protein [Hespellia sp.]